MATLIGLSGRAHNRDGTFVSRVQLQQRIENVRESTSLDWLLRHDVGPEFLFTSDVVRTPGQTTRKVDRQIHLATRTIYDYLDLFAVLTSRDPVRAFAALRPIDMRAESDRLAARLRWDEDIAIVADYEQRGEGRLSRYVAARDRNSARMREGFELSAIPRLPLMPAREPRSRTTVVDDPDGIEVLVNGLRQRVPAIAANTMIRSGRATWPVTLPDDGRTDAMRVRDRAWDDLTTGQRSAILSARHEGIDTVRRMLQAAGVDPRQVRGIRGIVGVTAEDVRGFPVPFESIDLDAANGGRPPIELVVRKIRI